MNRFSKLAFLLLIMMVFTIALPGLAQEGPSYITYNSYQSDPEPRAFDEQIVAQWNEMHPEMPVEHSIIAHEDFKQALRAYLTAEPAPDVLTWFAGNRAQFFIDRDLIADFSDMWAEQGFDEVYAPGFAALARAGTEDQYFFLPTSYYWWAIYYRPSIFESVGLEAPIETWDDLLGACDTLNEAGIVPFTIGTRYRWTAAAWFDYLNMRVNGPRFHLDLMLLKESYTDERVLAVFEVWEQLFEHNCFIEDPAAYSWQEAVDFLANGDAAMYLMGGFIVDSFPDELEDDLDFFQFPIIDPDVPIGEDAPTDGFFLAANARNLEGGKDFLAYLGSAEVQQANFETLGRLPTRTDVDISGADEATQKGIALVQSADLVVQFYDRDSTPEMADAGMNGFMDFWDDPDSIEDILEELEATRLDLLEEMEE